MLEKLNEFLKDKSINDIEISMDIKEAEPQERFKSYEATNNFHVTVNVQGG